MLNDEVGLCKIHDICGDITEEEHSNGCVCDTTTLPTPFFIITSSSTSSQPTVRPWRQSISESREREDPQLIILVRHIKFLWPWAYLLSSLFPSIRLGNLITSTTIGEWPFNASSYLRPISTVSHLHGIVIIVTRRTEHNGVTECLIGRTE